MKIDINTITTLNQWYELLDIIHPIQIRIADEVKRICEKHNIQYFMIAGTTLGAIRHQGFIPWDDDIDFGMLRKEYQKFMDVAKYELSSEYFLQTWHTDPNYGLPFAKIHYKKSKLIASNQPKSMQQNSGIFIDIFPYDFISRDTKIRKNVWNRYQYIARLLKLKNNYKLNTNSLIKKMAIYGLQLQANLQSRQKLIEHLEAIEAECNKQHHPSNLLITLGGWYGYEKEVMELDWCTNLNDKTFETSSYPCQVDYDAYLKHLYTDYMKLPPEDQRYNQHGLISIELEDTSS